MRPPSKYEPLADHMKMLPGSVWHTTFDEIERIIGAKLPMSAQNYDAF